MGWKLREWTLVSLLLLVVPVLMTGWTAVEAAQGTIATTLVSDTVYHADGTAATGTVIVSWGAFTTASGQTVPSGSTSATIGAGGALSVRLAPNAGSTPMGSYYTAIYHLDDGSVSREYWVVPVSSGATPLSAIKSQVLPASVAMQTVSKAYVDTAIAEAVTGHPLDSSTPYVLKTGDTMSGPLVLPGDPTSPTQAADKHYVDINVSASAGGLAQKVSLLPSGTQIVSQPSGTQLQVNLLNGTEYASQYATGIGGNGIANALASPDCANGCDVKVDPSYASTESYGSPQMNSSPSSGTHVEDTRGGARVDSYMNPVGPGGLDAGEVINVASTQNTASIFAQGGASDLGSFGVLINHSGLTGGSNLFPASLEPVPYFKTGYSALAVNGTYNTQGEHVLSPSTINCYGVGDCLIGSQFLTTAGGFRDEADEGTHPFDIQIQEDSLVFQGTCSAGCSTGSTVVTVSALSGRGTQGDGRYLIDKNPAKVLSAGSLIGGGVDIPSATATFSGTSFPVSTFLSTTALIPSQSNNVAPGTVSVAIMTSGVPSGFATNTAALPGSSGVACVVDRRTGGFTPHNYEMANYTVIDGTHLQMTLNKVHAAQATIAVGGLCGYGLEQTVDTVGGIRQVFPVIGSYSATGLYYAAGLTGIVGVTGQTSAFLNVNLPVAAIARSGNVVTVTTAGNMPVDLNGLTMKIAGVADSSYNGSFAVTTTGPNSLTYAETGANSTSSGGNISVLTGGYALYPMAEVLSVYNATTKQVDGQMTLAANNVAWAASDAVEEPHYYQENVSADTTFVTQTTPRPTLFTGVGVVYQSNVGPGLRGWTVTNAVPASEYLGNGGTHTVPDFAYVANGMWAETFDVQAGEQNLMVVRCNSHGCGKWNSGYNLFTLGSSAGADTIAYQPQNSILNVNVRGTTYGFTPQAFTAGTVSATTINATTVNATTLNGSLSANQLPVFGPSGSGHAPGAVPDPGAAAGASRYLREDGTWVTPPSGGGGGGSGVSVAALPVSGASADYHFLEGSGSTLADATGNGNTATLGAGALAPVWVTNGLAFTGQESVSLPAELNTSKTLCNGVYLTPLSTVIPTNQYAILISSSLGAAGANMMYAKNGNAFPSFALNIAPGSGARTQSNTLISGFHVACFVLGTGGGNFDHLYVDGQEVTYSTLGSSYGLQTSGNYFLGSSNTSFWTASGLNGTYYRFAAWPVQLTAAQIQAVSLSMQAEIAARGVPVIPATIPLAGPQLLASGTSITFGAGLSSPSTQAWPFNLSLTNQPSYTIQDYGISGIMLESINGSEANRLAPLCTTMNGPSVYILEGGENDFTFLGGSTAQSVFQNAAGIARTVKAAGCRAYIMTKFSRAGIDVNGNTFEADKSALDAVILESYKAAGFDGVIDAGAILAMGCDGCNTNSTYFQSDNVHPTAAGQLLIAVAVNNRLNYDNGYKVENPHYVATATYTMTAADGAVVNTTTANAAWTMPDCTGQSGAVYTISNPQSAHTLTIVGGTNQPINGLTSAITIPSNSTVKLTDVPNAKTVSGCQWVM